MQNRFTGSEDIPKQEVLVEGFGFDGPTDPDSEACYARRSGDKYWILRASYGSESGRMYNPYSLMHNPGQARKYERRTGQRAYTWTRASREQFDAYMKFLETKRTAYLNEAERSQGI